MPARVSSGATPASSLSPSPSKVAPSHSANSRTRMPHHIAGGAPSYHTDSCPSIDRPWSPPPPGSIPRPPSARRRNRRILRRRKATSKSAPAAYSNLRLRQALDSNGRTQRDLLRHGPRTDPLDKNFTGTRSYLKIGNGNKIREHFTISRGTPPSPPPKSANENFIHDLRPHRPQLQNRQPRCDRKLRAAGRVRGSGRWGVPLRRRAGAPVREDRPPSP